MASTNAASPRDDIFRAWSRSPELRDDTGAEAPLMYGHFAKFNDWTEINSMWEGNFLERIAPGAFKKTFRENRPQIKVLFQHGRDPQVGDKILGPIDDLREDGEGAYYEVPLLDTAYNRELLPGLEQDLYGASFRFQVTREEIVDKPGASEWNPNGLQERTIKEAKVLEFGPVSFPAYSSASAGLRSMTDEFILGRFMSEDTKLERLQEVIEYVAQERGILAVQKNDETKDGAERAVEQDTAPPKDGAAQEAHPVHGRREQTLYGLSRQSGPSWHL